MTASRPPSGSRPAQRPDPAMVVPPGEQTASFMAACWSDWRASCAVPKYHLGGVAPGLSRAGRGEAAPSASASRNRLTKAPPQPATGAAGVDEVLLQRLQPSGGGHQGQKADNCSSVTSGEGRTASGPPPTAQAVLGMIQDGARRGPPSPSSAGASGRRPWTPARSPCRRDRMGCSRASRSAIIWGLTPRKM